MAHVVKCSICGQSFDRDKIQAVRTGARRYAHLSCDPDNTDLVPLVIKETDDPDYTKLMDYIKKIYGDKANYPLIKKQIKKYTEEQKYSLSGILKSLVWFYDIKHNSVDGSNGGIGIVEYCYQDAYNYYLALFITQEANKNIVLDNKIKEVTIAPPEMRGTKQKLIDFGEWLDDEQ